MFKNEQEKNQVYALHNLDMCYKEMEKQGLEINAKSFHAHWEKNYQLPLTEREAIAYLVRREL
jgi:hypothetical protein